MRTKKDFQLLTYAVSLLFILFFTGDTFSQASAWVEQSLPLPVRPLKCVGTFATVYSNPSGWIGGDSGTVYYTSNNGANWFYRPVPQASQYPINTIDAIDWHSAICSYSSATETFIMKTTNDGVNWIQVYQQTGGRIYSLLTQQNNGWGQVTNIYALGQPVVGRWTILKSTNSGSSFDSSGLYVARNGNEVGYYNSFSFANNGGPYLAFGSSSNYVYRSTNGGTNWSVSQLPISKAVSIGYYWSFSFGIGCLVSDSISAAKSTNAGANWTAMSLPGTGANGIFVRDMNIYNGSIRIARGSEIYYSTNSGQSFALEYTAPNGGIYTDISIRTSVFEAGVTMGWAVRNNGGVSKYYIMFGGVKKIGSEVPKSFSLSQNYPNPFNLKTVIRFQVASDRFVTLKIFDVLGKEVAALVGQQLKPGTFQADWDGTNYPSGVYYYQLSVGDAQLATKKMMLLK